MKMPYSTVDDIKKMLPEDLIVQLTDDEATGSINQPRMEEAIAQADAEIDSYCGERYSVPFATVPDIVKKLSVDLAIYNLYSRLVRDMPEVRTERYRSSIRQLEAISKGNISLGVDPAPQAHSGGRAETNRPADENVFTREKLKGF
jgi:phage gp36-like protein